MKTEIPTPEQLRNEYDEEARRAVAELVPKIVAHLRRNSESMDEIIYSDLPQLSHKAFGLLKTTFFERGWVIVRKSAQRDGQWLVITSRRDSA